MSLLRRILGEVLRFGGGLIVPPVCVSCGAEAPHGRLLCAVCRNASKVLVTDIPPPMPGVLAWTPALRLEKPTRALVHALKYEGARSGAAELVDIALEAGASSPPRGGVLVPVPAHVSRRRDRGYDQALLLAQALGNRHGLEVCPCLHRRRATQSQTRLSAAHRRINLENAIVSRVPRGGTMPAICVLVDDVATTGSTLTACAAALWRGGAQHVVGWTALLADPAEDPDALGSYLWPDAPGHRAEG